MKSNDIYLSNQIKNMDESCGISPETLMENAARALYLTLEKHSRLGGTVAVFCGKGNNGGDGYALACLLLDSMVAVKVYAVDSPSSPLTVQYEEKYRRLGGFFAQSADEALCDADTVVDCMFGFSFRGTLGEKYSKIIRQINEKNAFVLAADIPSGLTADTDGLPNTAIKASACCTFSANKCATAGYPAKEMCGAVSVADIGIPKEVFDKHIPFAKTGSHDVLKPLPDRHENGHKGSFGTLAAVCGCEQMTGAAYLACQAAYRTGVGLVKLYTDKPCAQTVRSMLAEAVVCDSFSANDVVGGKHNALLIGCGFGRNRDNLVRELLIKTKIPTVLDADGINVLAESIDLYKSVNSSLIITPHPAEMGRLLGISAAEVNAARIECAKSFAKEYGFVTVLKGAGTVVAAPDGRLYVNNTGNSGLAKGGSGDVLAGIIASLLAQGTDSFNAAVIGVYIHGRAADYLKAVKGVYAILPSEVAEEAGKILYFG